MEIPGTSVKTVPVRSPTHEVPRTIWGIKEASREEALVSIHDNFLLMIDRRNVSIPARKSISIN